MVKLDIYFNVKYLVFEPVFSSLATAS